MLHVIRKYPVCHPLLKKYIRFFWELHIDNARLCHKLIPQRNINLKFNLNDTPHYIHRDGMDHLLEDVFFSGMQDRFINASLKVNGKVDVLGICFRPEGFYPFLKIPVSEIRNQLLGAVEAGCQKVNTISAQLKEAQDVNTRLNILEAGLVRLIGNDKQTPENFRRISNELKSFENSSQISIFCRNNGISIRQLERNYARYVGISAKSFITLNRFQNSMNQLLFKDYSKLSDIAYSNGYFDHMHFIKEFKRFAGNTPKSFVNQNNSILQIGKLI